VSGTGIFTTLTGVTLTSPGADPTAPSPRLRLLRFLRAFVRILSLIGAGWAIVAMASAWAGVYLQLFPSESEPIVTPEATRRYEIAAWVGLMTAVVCFVDALLARSRWHLACAGLLAVLTIGAAALFAVPHGRWDEQPQPRPTWDNSGYEPCYSGSNDCD
jgi:hypothetical protein